MCCEWDLMWVAASIQWEENGEKETGKKKVEIKNWGVGIRVVGV